jgi:hypothetical protein
MIVTYRPIGGWPGYRVGDDGSVWKWLASKGKRYPHRWRQLRHSDSKYPYVRLTSGGKLVSLDAGQLVLKAFVGPRPLGFTAYRFPDRSPGNCHLSNLRWAPKGTEKLGVAPPVRADNRGEKCSLAVLTREDVLEIRRMANSGEFSGEEIAEAYGISTMHAYKIVKGRRWGHLKEGVISEDRRFSKK